MSIAGAEIALAGFVAVALLGGLLLASVRRLVAVLES